METWLVNHVLGLSVLLLGLPRPLGAGTPSHNSTQPGTPGFALSEAANELGKTRNAATSLSYSSESLSPSQRNLLLTHTAETHTAANFDAKQTKSHTSPDSANLSTEPLSASFFTATEASSSNWKVFSNTDRMSGVPHPETLPQDSPDTTLRLGDATSFASQTAMQTDSTYTTTIGRAGERTLLSVTSSFSNISSTSNSNQPSSTWAIPPESAETEDYTLSAPSTRTIEKETTGQHTTETFSETRNPVVASETQTMSKQLNATHHQESSTVQETSESAPPLRVSEPNTGLSEMSLSSTPPFTSSPGAPSNGSGTDLQSGIGTSTESPTEVHSSSSQKHEATDMVSFQSSGNTVGLGLTAAPSAAATSTSGMNHTLTDMLMVSGILETTSPTTITERSQITEKDTYITMVLTTTSSSSTTPPPTTISPSLSGTSADYSSGSTIEATSPYTEPPTTVPTTVWQTSALHSTRSVSPSQTRKTFTARSKPTKATTLQTKASTVTQRVTTAHSLDVTTANIQTPPTKSPEILLTTQKTQDRGVLELLTTTVPTYVQTTKTPIKNPCVINPCLNGGTCFSSGGPEYTCRCQQAWTGPTCNVDVDECENYRCPTGSTCINTQGSFSCDCPLGFDLKDGRTCTKAKTFLGTFSFNRHENSIKSYAVHDIQGELLHLLNVSLSVLQGYTRSTLNKNLTKIREYGEVRISVVNLFSISTDVTNTKVNDSIQMFLSNQSSLVIHRRVVLSHLYSYHTESLCEVQKTQCDKERSTCSDGTGTALCQCHHGYYKHNPDDLSCLECGDGYKLENGTCVPCMFGFGGFNCGNFYKLIAVVVSPAGGGLLLILIIALIVTCCKKDKNDINKIIFKSGDLQMSPYADFPKNNRISMEWGRETIEMQENGSTKNLLQMTDIYYSPALRNADLDRNGLYPFTGLPGSRHSCIYPAQWNPSFISDDSRRRDYF